MIQVLAPRVPRGWSRVWLPVAIATLVTASAWAQAPGGSDPKAEPAKQAKGEPKPDAKPAGGEAAEVANLKPTAVVQELYPDPQSKQAVQIFNPLPYPNPPLKMVGTPNDRQTVLSMAAGNLGVNPDLLRRYIDFYAAELTKKDNLNLFLNRPDNANPTNAKAIERAVDDLVQPLLISRANNQPNFTTAYTRQLFESSLPKLLDNNLISRLDAMIVLATAASRVPKDLDLYITQIGNANQVMWVRQWAAHAITLATNDGRFTLEASKRDQALEALAKFLGGDAKAMPWLVQFRALEAVGSLRVAINVTSRSRVDAASVVMPYLTDTAMRPEVRAYAARALGWMAVPDNVRGYNFALIGDAIGQLAADLGDRIVAEYNSSGAPFSGRFEQAKLYTSLLIFQVNLAINGDPTVKDSGLAQMTHPEARAQSAYFRGLSEKIQAEIVTAYELVRAPGVNIEQTLRDKLVGQVKDLRAFLASKPPKDRNLVADAKAP